MEKFDKLYNKIKNKISIITEDFNINQDSSFNDEKFDFKKDDNNNIICSFSITIDGNQLLVIGKVFNNELTFITTDNNGNSINLNEKEFALKYYKDYEDFKKALDKYIKSDDVVEDDNIENGKINSMTSEMDNEINNDESIKYEKEFEIDNSKFIFKLLNDISVENYCECIFDFQDKTNEIIYVRALLNIMKENSVIIKLLLFNEHGELLEKLTKTEFYNRYKSKYDELTKAIKKMELFVSEQ